MQICLKKTKKQDKRLSLSGTLGAALGKGFSAWLVKAALRGGIAACVD